MLETRKITAHLPEDLLEQAMKITGKGITETLREGLQRVTREDAYEQLRALRGKVKPEYSLEILRYDRE